MSDLPACGLYRTTRPLESVPAGALVYFHNHGEPGPGVYLPSGWAQNRARWHARGQTVQDPEWARSLHALPAEGLYRVRERFFCCERRCRAFEPEALVQLGYDAQATPILFVPAWGPQGLVFPDAGSKVDEPNLEKLVRLAVDALPSGPATAPGGLVH